MQESSDLVDNAAEWTKEEAFYYLKRIIGGEEGDHSVWLEALKKVTGKSIEPPSDHPDFDPYLFILATLDEHGMVWTNYRADDEEFNRTKSNLGLGETRFYLKNPGLKETIRGEMVHLRVMELLRELTATLSRDDDLSAALKASRVAGVLRGDYSISSLSDKSHSSAEKQMADVIYLREKMKHPILEKDKIKQCDSWVDYNIQLSDKVEKERGKVLDLLADQKKKATKKGVLSKSPILHLIKVMDQALTEPASKHPKLTEFLKNFFECLLNILDHDCANQTNQSTYSNEHLRFQQIA